jgi:hypothetical protein
MRASGSIPPDTDLRRPPCAVDGADTPRRASSRGRPGVPLAFPMFMGRLRSGPGRPGATRPRRDQTAMILADRGGSGWGLTHRSDREMRDSTISTPGVARRSRRGPCPRPIRLTSRVARPFLIGSLSSARCPGPLSLESTRPFIERSCITALPLSPVKHIDLH